MQAINAPIGMMNKVTDTHLVPNTDYIDALNIRTDNGAVIPVRGNFGVNIPNMPTGTSKFIGAIEDPSERKAIFFVANSNNNHNIIEYRNGAARRLGSINGQGIPGLGLSSTRYIHSAQLIDSDYLTWPDGIILPSGQITGARPKKLSLKRLDRAKTLTHVVNFEPSAFTVGNNITYTVTDQAGAVIYPLQTVYTVMLGDTPQTVVANVAGAISGLAGSTTQHNIGDLFFTVQHPGSGRICTVGGGAHAIPSNYYREGITEDEFCLALPFPKNPPVPFYDRESGRTNRVQRPHQFRFRYRFWDGTLSAWGPCSYVPSNFKGALTDPLFITVGDYLNDSTYNKIVVEINDSLLNLWYWRSLITGIDVAFKSYDEGVWRYAFKNVDVRAQLLGTISLDFYGTSNAEAIPSDEAGSPDTQALKNYDFVPRVALTHELATDRGGSTIAAWAGILEGYPLPKVRAVASIVKSFINAPNPAVRQGSPRRTMKSGGRYRVGIVYENLHHQSAVIPIGIVEVPFDQHEGALNLGSIHYYIRVQINSNPPSWATHYRIVVSKNLNQIQYVQIPFYSVNFWKINVQNNTATIEPNIENSTHIGFSWTRKAVDQITDKNVLFDRRESGERLFIPVNGDRLQILQVNDEAVEIFPPNILAYNYAIAGYCLTWPAVSSQDYFTVFVKNEPNIPLWIPSDLFPQAFVFGEIYKQANSDDGLYYELGTSYAITNGAHATNPVELVQYGDAYTKSVKFYAQSTAVVVNGVHDEVLHIWDTKGHSDHGRPHIENPDYGEKFEFDKIRASDAYISGTSINGLSSFRGTNYIRIPRNNGPIHKLVNIDNVMLAISTARTQPIYVGKSQLLDLSGNRLVGKAQELFNLADELKFDYGTYSPRSIVYDEGNVYGWDGQKGVIWRYSAGAGQFPVTDYKMSDYFVDRSQRLQSGGFIEEVVGGHQREFGVLYMSFAGYDDRGTPIVFPETWGFEEQQRGNPGNRFISKYSFIPEVMVSCGQEFFTATTSLWKHEQGSYCSFYGNFFGCNITIVVNEAPEIVKNFLRINIEAATQWTCSYISIPATSSYPSGMLSVLSGNKLTAYEGQWMGDFLRDQLDPDPRFNIYPEPERTVRKLLGGRPLRGEVAVIQLQLSNPQSYSALRKIFTTFEVSKIV